MATKLRDTPEWQRGHEGELIVMRLLQQSGWYVVPTFDYTSVVERAPCIQGARGSLLLPDLDCSQGGVRLWVEVKTKTAPMYYFSSNRLEHGLNLRHYEQYRRIAEETGTPVWLAVYEQDSKQTLWGELSVLAHHGRRYDDGAYVAMMNFLRDDFTEVSPDCGQQLNETLLPHVGCERG